MTGLRSLMTCPPLLFIKINGARRPQTMPVFFTGAGAPSRKLIQMLEKPELARWLHGEGGERVGPESVGEGKHG
jgi:hypothetical protein